MANHFSVSSYDCNPKVRQALMLSDVEMIQLDAPALLIDPQAICCVEEIQVTCTENTSGRVYPGGASS